MNVTINSSTESIDNILANNDKSIMLVVKSITISSNTSKGFTLGYESGDVITPVEPTSGKTQVIFIDNVFDVDNVGKDLIISVEVPLVSNETIYLSLDIDTIKTPTI